LAGVLVLRVEIVDRAHYPVDLVVVAEEVAAVVFKQEQPVLRDKVMMVVLVLYLAKTMALAAVEAQGLLVVTGHQVMVVPEEQERHRQFLEQQ
jgi:hypothetical protein